MSDVAVWIVLFHLGLLGLNWPLLEVFRGALFEYLLVFWLLFVSSWPGRPVSHFIDCLDTARRGRPARRAACDCT